MIGIDGDRVAIYGRRKRPTMETMWPQRVQNKPCVYVQQRQLTRVSERRQESCLIARTKDAQRGKHQILDCYRVVKPSSNSIILSVVVALQLELARCTVLCLPRSACGTGTCTLRDEHTARHGIFQNMPNKCLHRRMPQLHQR